MTIEFSSPKLVFKEITYKLKKPNLNLSKSVSAQFTLNISNSKIEGQGERFFYWQPIEMILDTEDLFFEADCIFKAELLGVELSDQESIEDFFETNKDQISSLSKEILRNDVNTKIHSLLSMTVTAPAKNMEFWPKEG